MPPMPTPTDPRTMACPACWSGALGVVKQIRRTANVTVTTDAAGTVRLDEHSDASDRPSEKLVAVLCRDCDWTYEGADWASRLVPDPDMLHVAAAVLADIDKRADTTGHGAMPGWEPQVTHRVVERLRRGVDTTDPRALFLANVLPNRLGADLVYADDLPALYGQVIELWPLMRATLT